MWLADGSLCAKTGAVTFAQAKQSHVMYVHWALEYLGLESPAHFSYKAAAAAGKQARWCIKKPSWLTFWLKYFGAKDETAHECVRSCNELPQWCFTLPADLARNVIAGVHLADGRSADVPTCSDKCDVTLICTSSHSFRDDVCSRTASRVVADMRVRSSCVSCCTLAFARALPGSTVLDL
jgi:hypothetical protein